MITGKHECSCPERVYVSAYNGMRNYTRLKRRVVKKGRMLVCKECGAKAPRKKFMAKEGTLPC